MRDPRRGVLLALLLILLIALAPLPAHAQEDLPEAEDHHLLSRHAGAAVPAPPDTLPSDSHCGGVRFLPDHALESSWARTEAILAGAGEVGYRTRTRAALFCGSFLEVRAGGAEERGRLALVPGRPPGSGSEPLPDRGGVALRVRGEGDLHPRVRVGGEWSATGQRVRGDAAYGEFLLGPLYAWVGRRAPAYGPGRGGGVILSGVVPLDGIGVGTTRPVRLPWRLSRVGKVDFETVLARGADNGDIGKPFILAGRGTLSFRENLVLGANRGIMFGGEGVPGLTVRRVFWMLVGDHQYENDRWIQIDNQIASFDLAWRVTPGGVPVLLFLEWGLEDSNAAWIRSPGIVTGVEAVDPDRGLRLGLEHARLFRENGFGIWYRHGTYRAGWSDAGRLLGHPLGGPGIEWLLHGALHPPRRPWDLQAGLRTRFRYSQNSFAPYREGRALGGFLEGRVRTGLVDLYLQMDGERLPGGSVVGAGEGGIRWRLGAGG